MPKPTLDADRILKRATPVTGQHAHEIQPFGHLVRMPIHTDLEHRVFYVATFADAVHVLYAFEKRTRKTPKRDLDLAGDRFRALVRERQADAKQK